MGFLIYKRTAAGENLRFERVTPLKLSGADGLIARHVRALPAGETASWKLEAAALLKLAGYECDHFTVMFDMAGGDATAACLYGLKRIHGSCRDTSTNLALDFNVMVDQETGDDAVEFARSFVVPLKQTPKRLGEMLALSGGPGGGDWKWTASGVNLGATVVQPRSHAPASLVPTAPAAAAPQ